MTDLPEFRLWHDPLEHWAATQPDALCITYEDQQYTWGEWVDRVHRLAGALRAAGVRRGDRVASLAANNVSTLEMTAAAAMLGAGHVIYNSRLIGEQLAYVLSDSSPRVLVLDVDLLEVFDQVRDDIPAIDRIVHLGGDNDEYQAFVAGGEAVDADPAVEPDDTVLVMYSSGTTGFPKGIELTHHNMTMHSAASNDHFKFEPGVTGLVAMPLFHVGGSSFAQLVMYYGATSVLLKEVHPPTMFQWISRGADRLFLVPSVVAAVLEAGDQAIALFGKVKVFAYGASPMPLPLLRGALETWPDVDFMQVYGMTEFGGIVTILSPEAHRDAAHPERLTSAGEPLPGIEARVVNPDTLQDVERGETGELWFRTEQSMKGYLNKPEATAETITSDGWLRTGDLGRMDHGGFIYILDRLKDMIVTGGENVYSPEVENVIAAHPKVAEVAVLGVPHPKWVEAVHAVVVPKPGETIDPDDIIAFTKERLASYKCPKTIDVVEAMPRNTTGKILKRELRARHSATAGDPLSA
jgi:acyl-CoA synthetase (AMP-forming)/AMP-acid ligase II